MNKRPINWRQRGFDDVSLTVMGRLRNRSPSGRPRRKGARRAGMTALALLAGTVALAVLSAVLFHLGVAAVVVAILGSLPALYLAWAALPGAIASPGGAGWIPGRA